VARGRCGPHSGTWNLRDSAEAGPVDYGPFVYGGGTAYPVTGDWDSNGNDTVGYKAGTLWSLRNTNNAGESHVVFNFGAANDLPFVWRVS
jgi:hypothetical protein